MKKGLFKKMVVLGICLGLVLAIGGCGSSDSKEDLSQQEQGVEGEGTTDPALGEDGAENPA